MAFKQPRVPQMREEGLTRTVRELILFLKDFCIEAWTHSIRQEQSILALRAEVEAIRLKLSERQ